MKPCLISIGGATIIMVYSFPASAGASLILWGEIEAGMSIQQVRQIYPEQRDKVKWHGTKQTEIEDIEILKGCYAEVEIQHKQGVVDVVKIKGRGSAGGRCADKVLGALGTKYGQPSVQRETQGSIFTSQGTISFWNKDGITMRFKQFERAGLATASWELSYSASASEIEL